MYDIPIYALTESTPDFSSVITSITGTISVQTVVTTLAYIAGVGVGFVFMWFGLRKGIRSLMAAIKSGKLSVG